MKMFRSLKLIIGVFITLSVNGISAEGTTTIELAIKDINYKAKGEIIITDPNNQPLTENAKFIKVKVKTYGKGGAYAPLVPALDALADEVKKQGYRYFQIVYPAQISNLNGFPINNKHDLVAFVQPAIDMPRDKLNLFETKLTLMDSQEGQKVVNIPLTVFGDTEVELIARVVENPAYDEVVWDTQINQIH